MIDKETFLKAVLPEETLSLPGVGDVRVRGLTRQEAVNLSHAKGNVPALECLIIKLGLVEPVLTSDEIKTWYESSPSGLTDLIVNAVTRLSSLDEGAAKSGLPEV